MSKTSGRSPFGPTTSQKRSPFRRGANGSGTSGRFGSPATAQSMRSNRRHGNTGRERMGMTPCRSMAPWTDRSSSVIRSAEGRSAHSSSVQPRTGSAPSSCTGSGHSPQFGRLPHEPPKVAIRDRHKRWICGFDGLLPGITKGWECDLSPQPPQIAIWPDCDDALVVQWPVLGRCELVQDELQEAFRCRMVGHRRLSCPNSCRWAPAREVGSALCWPPPPSGGDARPRIFMSTDKKLRH